MGKKTFNINVSLLLIFLLILFFMPFIFDWNTLGDIMKLALGVIFLIYFIVYVIIYLRKKNEVRSYTTMFIFSWITILFIFLLEYSLYSLGNNSEGVGPGAYVFIPLIFFGALAFITFLISIISAIVVSIKKDSSN